MVMIGENDWIVYIRIQYYVRRRDMKLRKKKTMGFDLLVLIELYIFFNNDSNANVFLRLSFIPLCS